MILTTDNIQQVIKSVVGSPSVSDKINIHSTHHQIGEEAVFKNPTDNSQSYIVRIGDDCAALPDGHGSFLLFASEGIIPSFVQEHPWFAGYSAVMVNISDVCAMGGLPIALTDVLWVKDEQDSRQIWEGMKAASEAYGVPIAGGHTCYRSEVRNLAVSIVGKADRLLTSFSAQAGDSILVAVDLTGNYYAEYPFWNASTNSTSESLKSKMAILHTIANEGYAHAAKDISMGGIIGSLAMLLNSSKVGADLSIDSLPAPDNTSLEKWLITFPSYGFILCCNSCNEDTIIHLFEKQNIACKKAGYIRKERELRLLFEELEIETLKL